ncbi:uncharacterized protein [Rutidosis leptorrhynchoides]|uniref:uncharacterized protein n=1 Tax=Rutidosis leptorrhynchoides TaxID=125765 RepID=UPI003A99B224
MEKLAALTRFLSKDAERQLPFFKTLKGCLKQKSFVWTSEAETAFQEMKKLLKTLPTLRAPVDGEILYLYVSVENEAFGSVLVAEKDKIQKPVYFVMIDEIWDLFTDGASCAEAAGAGLVLASPSGEEHKYALRFNFDVTNNEAEYEALLTGLNIARKMNITRLRVLKELAELFEYFELAQVPRSQNKKADALSKLAALTFSHFQKQVWVEELPSNSIDNDLMVASVEEEQPNWMEPILCQRHAPQIRMPRHDMIPINSPWLFHKWAIDIVGPFPTGPSNVKFLIVAIDYFTKWVEAKAVRTINGVQVQNFVWEYIVCRFGIPRELVSDIGAQIAKDPFKTCCTDLNIIQKFTSVVHPPANGLCEVTNRDIVSDIKRGYAKSKLCWVDKLPNVLWAHLTTFKKSTGETPFSLVYGSEAVIPAEILVPTHRVANFEEEANDDALGENLNFIEE